MNWRRTLSNTDEDKLVKLEELSPEYQKYLKPFFDNPLCEQAFDIARRYCLTDESLIDEALFIAATVAGNDDDDLFIVSLLHDLAGEHNKDLWQILQGFPYKLTKNIQSLRIQGTEEEQYMRIATYVDKEFQCIEVARKMYALTFAAEDTLEDMSELLDTINESTSKLSMSMSLKIQLNAVYAGAVQMYNTLEQAEALLSDELIPFGEADDEDIPAKSKEERPYKDGWKTADEKAQEEIKGTDQDDYLEHKRLADELGICNGESRLIPGVGYVTYFTAVGFCTSFGELIDLSKVE